MIKLVRDNMPEIFLKKNVTAKFYSVDREEYYKLLVEKLNEEVKEFSESYETEELADIMEVVEAILKYKEIPKAYFEKIKLDKANKNGRFERRIVLEQD